MMTKRIRHRTIVIGLVILPTSARTRNGFILPVVKDLFTKKIVGYAYSNHIDTHSPIPPYLWQFNAKNPSASLIFHNDRGSQLCQLYLQKFIITTPRTPKYVTTR